MGASVAAAETQQLELSVGYGKRIQSRSEKDVIRAIKAGSFCHPAEAVAQALSGSEGTSGLWTKGGVIVVLTLTNVAACVEPTTSNKLTLCCPCQ
jgi:hypothetical protein